MSKKKQMAGPSGSKRNSVAELFSPVAESLNEMFSSPGHPKSSVGGSVFGGPAANVAGKHITSKSFKNKTVSLTVNMAHSLHLSFPLTEE